MLKLILIFHYSNALYLKQNHQSTISCLYPSQINQSNPSLDMSLFKANWNKEWTSAHDLGLGLDVHGIFLGS